MKNIDTEKINNLEQPFVHLYQTEMHNYAYDVNSNEIIQVSELVFDILCLLESGIENDLIPALLSEKHDSSCINNDLEKIRELQQNKLLFLAKKPSKIAMSCCEDHLDHLYDKYIEMLTLEVTRRCNFRCKYCILSASCYPNHPIDNNQDMDWDVAKPMLDYMIQHGGHQYNPYIKQKESRDFSIGFYGGEPLLRVDFILKCMQYLRSSCNTDRCVSFTLTTNGSRLNQTVIKQLMEYGTSFVISLDGPQSIHDRMRVWNNGAGSYNDAILAIQNLQETAKTLYRRNGRPHHHVINSVVSGDFDWYDLWDYFTNLEPLLNTQYANFSILFSGLSGGISHWNSSYPDDPISPPKHFADLVDEYKKACLNGVYSKNPDAVEWRFKILDSICRKFAFFAIHGRTRLQFEENSILNDMCHPGGMCFPGKRRPFLSASGILYPCERVPQETYFEIGNYVDGVNMCKVKKIIDEYTQPTVDECTQCWAIRMCGEGCSKDFVTDSIFDDELKRNRCVSIRNKRHRELVGMCELLEKNPAALDHFNNTVVG